MVLQALEYFEQMREAFNSFCRNPDFGVRFEQSAPMHPFEVAAAGVEDDDVEILGAGDEGDAFGVSTLLWFFLCMVTKRVNCRLTLQTTTKHLMSTDLLCSLKSSGSLLKPCDRELLCGNSGPSHDTHFPDTE